MTAVTIGSGYALDRVGYGDLGIRKKQTNISVLWRCHSSYDVTSTSGVMGSVPGSG